MRIISAGSKEASIVPLRAAVGPALEVRYDRFIKSRDCMDPQRLPKTGVDHC